MKICILGDCHFGMRNDNLAFHQLYRRFYEETFIPYLVKHKIKNVLQMGDLFDRRKYINFHSLALAKEYFFDPLEARAINLHTLIGNHDIFYKNTLKVNSPSLVLGDHANITIYDEPTEVQFGSLKLDIIPWVCEENQQQIIDFISNSNNKVCAGHFELKGFEMDRGNVCHEGWEASNLSKYQLVLTGHFHHMSQKGNIFYVGSPGEITWADYDDQRGFHILDTETLEMEFIRNPHTIFRKIPYNDDELYFDDVQKKDFSEYTGKYVKVVVVKKTNAFLFETFIDNLNKAQPQDVTIVEDFTEIDIADEHDIDQADDTISIIEKVVDGLEIDLQKGKLKSILREVYTEALATQS